MNNVVYFALMGVLAVASVVDIRTRLVPLWIIAACAGLWVLGECIGALPISPLDGVLAALVLGGTLLAGTCVAEHLKGEALLGGGDILLLACIALFLGLEKVLWCLLGACVLGLVWAVVSRQREFPFVPPIAASTTAMLILSVYV